MAEETSFYTPTGTKDVEHTVQNIISIPGLYARKEYRNIIEIYDIPVELKSSDVENHFKSYNGFCVRWVDDNSALGIFPTSTIAAKALRNHESFLPIKVRELAEANKLTQLKAQRLIEQIMMENLNVPSVDRPPTNTAIAKRLINGHLGLTDFK